MPSRKESTVEGGKLRFGVFEADLSSGELWKHGTRVHVQTLPFKLLSVLLEQPGHVVSREELQQRLWGTETVVDFDRCLGTAINKVREALGDSADKPRYIETLSKRGFRFIAPIQVLSSETAPVGVPAHDTTDTDNNAPALPVMPVVISTPAAPDPARAAGIIDSRRAMRFVALFTCLLVVILAVSVAIAITSSQRLTHISRITWSDRVFPGDILRESFSKIVTDGTQIYFSETKDGQFVAVNASPADGESYPLHIPSEIVRPSISDVSKDGARLLVQSHQWSQIEEPLWVVSSLGNSAYKVGNILSHDAAWAPDGRQILYGSGNDIFLVDSDGNNARKLASVGGRAFWLRYSPDGTRIRFTLLEPMTRTTSLWEMKSDGTHIRALLSGWNTPSSECCGNWTNDGKYYVFQSTREGLTSIWSLRDDWVRFVPHFSDPVQLTAGPINFQSPVPAQRSNQIFVIGADVRSRPEKVNSDSKSLLSRYDFSSRQFVPYLPELNGAVRAEFSKDKSRVAWVSNADGSLWQSKMDGTQRMRLTSFPFRIYMMRWSPDGQTILVMGKKPEDRWKVYAVSADGGPLAPLVDEASSEADPQWSPDGKTIYFGRSPSYMAEDASEKAIYSFDVNTRKASVVAGSHGLFSPRLSPDGRYLAAMPIQQRRLMLFDLSKQQWTEISDKSVDNPVWSSDGKWVYFHAFMEEGEPIYRVHAFDRRIERVVDFRNLQPAEGLDYLGLTDRGEPIVAFHLWTANVYSIEVK